MGAVHPAFRHLQSVGARGLTDERLVALVASGDDQAFEEIFDRYSPALLAFCVHMLGSREWGEDALQLTWVAAYKALRRGGCDGAVRPWLYAIARNRCLSELRAPREIPDSDGVNLDQPSVDGPASVVARREELHEIVEDLHRLPADQCAALVLFELGDQSHEEIATVLGVRREKVKALIFQAREGLHRARIARESACLEARKQLANGRGKVPARGAVRAHIERCALCQEFAREVRRQRAALALVLPVALSGQLKALVLSSAVSQGGTGAGIGAGGAGSLSAASTVSSGSATVPGSGSLASAAGSAGSASTAAGGGAASTAAGTAAPTMVGTGSVANAGALTSSVSLATVAKLAAVVAFVVGVGEVARIVLAPSHRPHVSSPAGQPKHAAPLRSPFQPPVPGIDNLPTGATQPGAQVGAGAAAAAAATARALASSADPTAGSGASGSHTTSGGPPNSLGSHRMSGRPNGSGSHTTPGGPSAGSGAHKSPGGPPSVSRSEPGGSTGHAHSSGGHHGRRVGHTRGIRPSRGNGPPKMPPGCVDNPAPGCVKKRPRF